MHQRIGHINYFWFYSFTLWLLVVLQNGANAQLAVIASRENPVDRLSMDELQAVFMGKSMLYENNETIMLCEFEPDKNSFCNSVYGFSAKRMSKYWFKLVFSGAVVSAPENFKDEGLLIKYLIENPRAIGFIDLSRVGTKDGIKVIKVEGLETDDAVN